MEERQLFVQDGVYRSYNNAWATALDAQGKAQSATEKALADSLTWLAQGLRDERAEVLRARLRENLKSQ